MCSQDGCAVSLVGGPKVAWLCRARVVPEPLVSHGRRSEDRLEGHGFPVL